MSNVLCIIMIIIISKKEKIYNILIDRFRKKDILFFTKTVYQNNIYFVRNNGDFIRTKNKNLILIVRFHDDDYAGDVILIHRFPDDDDDDVDNEVTDDDEHLGGSEGVSVCVCVCLCSIMCVCVIVCARSSMSNVLVFIIIIIIIIISKNICNILIDRFRKKKHLLV